MEAPPGFGFRPAGWPGRAGGRQAPPRGPPGRSVPLAAAGLCRDRRPAVRRRGWRRRPRAPWSAPFHGLGHDEVGGRLDIRLEAILRQPPQHQRAGSLLGQRLQRRPEALLGEGGRVETAGEPTQLLERPTNRCLRFLQGGGVGIGGALTPRQPCSGGLQNWGTAVRREAAYGIAADKLLTGGRELHTIWRTSVRPRRPMADRCSFCGSTAGPYSRVEGLFTVLMCADCQAACGHGSGPFPVMTPSSDARRPGPVADLGAGAEGQRQPPGHRRHAEATGRRRGRCSHAPGAGTGLAGAASRSRRRAGRAAEASGSQPARIRTARGRASLPPSPPYEVREL
jgi:hypothetical protein